MLGIVTVAYQEEARLTKTLNSLTLLDASVEHIVVIPEGDQLSMSTLHNFLGRSNRNTKVVMDSMRGIYAAMNLGIRASESTHLMFLNAGDEILSRESFEQFEKQLSTCESVWGICDAEFEWQVTNVQSLRELMNFLCQESGYFLSHQTVAFQKESLIRVGGYNERFLVAGDTELILEFSRIGSPCFFRRKTIRVEKPNFAAKRNRKGRSEIFWILVFKGVSGQKILSIFRFLRQEASTVVRKYYAK